METTGFSETLVLFYLSIRCHTPEDSRFIFTNKMLKSVRALYISLQHKELYFVHWMYWMDAYTVVLFFKSRNRPGVAQRVQGGLGSQISWHSAREGGEVVSHTHRPPLPPGMFLVLIFTKGWVDPRAMVRSEGDMSLVTWINSDHLHQHSRLVFVMRVQCVKFIFRVWIKK